MKYVTKNITSKILLFYYLGNPAFPFLDYIIQQNPSFVKGFYEKIFAFFEYFLIFMRKYSFSAVLCKNIAYFIHSPRSENENYSPVLRHSARHRRRAFI